MKKNSHFEIFKTDFEGKIQCPNPRTKVFDSSLTTNIHKHIHFDLPYLLLTTQFYPIHVVFI